MVDFGPKKGLLEGVISLAHFGTPAIARESPEWHGFILYSNISTALMHGKLHSFPNWTRNTKHSCSSTDKYHLVDSLVGTA